MASFSSSGPRSFYSSKLAPTADEDLYLASTRRRACETSSDKENTSRFEKRPTTNTSRRTENRAFIAEIYDGEYDETDEETFLTPLKEIEESPYYFSYKRMPGTYDHSQSSAEQRTTYRPDHYTQTHVDQHDHSTFTDDDLGNGSDSSYESPLKSKRDYALTPTKYRIGKRKPLSDVFPTRDTDDRDGHGNRSSSSNSKGIFRSSGDTYIIPTKYQPKGRQNSFRTSGGYGSPQKSPPHSSREGPRQQPPRIQIASPEDDRSSRDRLHASPPHNTRDKPSRERSATSPPGRYRSEPPRREPSPSRVDRSHEQAQRPPPAPPKPRRDHGESPQDYRRQEDPPYVKPSPTRLDRRNEEPIRGRSPSREDDYNPRREPSRSPPPPSQPNRRPESAYKEPPPTRLDRRTEEPIRGRSPPGQPDYNSRREPSRSPPPPSQPNRSRQEPPNTRPPTSGQQRSAGPAGQLFHPYQIVEGHLEFRDKSLDDNEYGHESDPSDMEVVFTATLRGPDARTIAQRNRQNEYDRQNPDKPTNKQPLNPNNSGGIKIKKDEDNRTISQGFKEGLRPGSEPPAPSRYGPTEDRYLKEDEPPREISKQRPTPPTPSPRDPTPSNPRSPGPDNTKKSDNYHQFGRPTSPISSPPPSHSDTRYLNVVTNVRRPLTQLDINQQYNFGGGDKNAASDEYNSEPDCVAFGHEAQPKRAGSNQRDYPGPGASTGINRFEKSNPGISRETGTTAGNPYEEPHNPGINYSAPRDGRQPAVPSGYQQGVKGLANAQLGASTNYNGSQARPGNYSSVERTAPAGVYGDRETSRTNPNTSQRNRSPNWDQSTDTYENRSPDEDNFREGSYAVNPTQTANPRQNTAQYQDDDDDEDEDEPPRSGSRDNRRNGYYQNDTDEPVQDTDTRGRRTASASGGGVSTLFTQNPLRQPAGSMTSGSYGLEPTGSNKPSSRPRR